MMLALTNGAPRGSNSSRWRIWSRGSSRYSFFSNIVLPGTSTTPPVTTLPTSPSAWQPTTVNARSQRIYALLLSGDAAIDRGRAEVQPPRYGRGRIVVGPPRTRRFTAVGAGL